MRSHKVLFIGSKLLGLKCLKLLHNIDPESLMGVLTIDDRFDSRSVFLNFKKYCRDNNLLLYVARDRKDSEEIIVNMHPTLCVVIGWYWIIGADTLHSIPDGVVGIHNSSLPRYRGGAPVVWAMINGEFEVGVTLFSLSEGMDDGDIWDQRIVKIEVSDYISDVLNKLDEMVLEILKQKYPLILAQSIRPYNQNENGVTYGAQRMPEDGVINWGWSSVQIYNFIRAQSKPYPGAFTYYREKKLTIWRASPLDVTYYGTPGQVAKIDQTGVYVICGDQKPIVLQEVRFDSFNDLPAQDILKSIKIRLGPS